MQQDNRVYIQATTSPVIEVERTRILHDLHWIQDGRIWMATQYYDKDECLQKKHPELIKGFRQLARWLKKRIPISRSLSLYAYHPQRR